MEHLVFRTGPLYVNGGRVLPEWLRDLFVSNSKTRRSIDFRINDEDTDDDEDDDDEGDGDDEKPWAFLSSCCGTCRRAKIRSTMYGLSAVVEREIRVSPSQVCWRDSGIAKSGVLRIFDKASAATLTLPLCRSKNEPRQVLHLREMKLETWRPCNRPSIDLLSSKRCSSSALTSGERIA
eukprot:CAMPEP_0194037676 /NCGR_PEP_ID=MMETSP0009_2-20130614/10006_1 /TAXON_ID=210454 /ORGANISM="Grammatophora oceanica, Strain CCMP 410" /LENGTH=178 /DNA_ID=CAMNT_0038679929 /DNA_START=1676 /DNA_END=2209 /DNA_ORIENTATION=-